MYFLLRHVCAMTATQKLTARIEAFLDKHKMNRRRFGVLALSDPNFVYDLQAGRRTPTIETAAKIEAFMESMEKPDTKRRAKA